MVTAKKKARAIRAGLQLFSNPDGAYSPVTGLVALAFIKMRLFFL